MGHIIFSYVNDVLIVLILLNTTPGGWFMGVQIIFSFTWIILHFQISYIPHSTKKASRLVHQITVLDKNYSMSCVFIQHSQHLWSDCCRHGTLVHRNSWKLWNCSFLGNSSHIVITQRFINSINDEGTPHGLLWPLLKMWRQGCLLRDNWFSNIGGKNC